MERSKAIDIIRKNWPYGRHQLSDALETLIPELRKSEDEMIKEEIEVILANTDLSQFALKYTFADMLTWLEKQHGEQNRIPRFKVGDFVKDTNYRNEPIYEVVYIDSRCYICEYRGKENMGDRAVMHFAFENPYLHLVQKPTDNVEPKFKVGDWIVQQGVGIFKIIEICKSWYEVIDCTGKRYSIAFLLENECQLCAKNGDVLAAKIDEEPNDFIYIFKEYDQNFGFRSHCYLDAYINKFHEGTYHNNYNVGVPATKEQRDLLFQKMKEAGYEWNAKKKELKKIEQNPIEPDNLIEESYQRQADNLFDMVTETLAWSKEDEKMLSDIDDFIKHLPVFYETIKINGKEKTTEQFVSCARNWLKSLKDRVLSQSKQKWSEGDEKKFRDVIRLVEQGAPVQSIGDHYTDWLKSLKERYSWKPSNGQIKAIEESIEFLGCTKKVREDLKSLYEQLKKLRG